MKAGEPSSYLLDKPLTEDCVLSPLPSQVTDFSRPVCLLLSLQANCSGDCSLSTWTIAVKITDGVDGTGIERIELKQGNGTLTTSTSVDSDNVNVTLASYTASCCSPEVELLVVDKVGNVGSCFFNNTPTPTPNPATVSIATKAAMSSYLCLITAIILTYPTELGIH